MNEAQGPLEVVSSHAEFETIPIRRYENALLRRIYDRVPPKLISKSTAKLTQKPIDWQRLSNATNQLLNFETPFETLSLPSTVRPRQLFPSIAACRFLNHQHLQSFLRLCNCSAPTKCRGWALKRCKGAFWTRSRAYCRSLRKLRCYLSRMRKSMNANEPMEPYRLLTSEHEITQNHQRLKPTTEDPTLG